MVGRGNLAGGWEGRTLWMREDSWGSSEDLMRERRAPNAVAAM